MEVNGQSELEKKYHVLALEYSKIRSQATVLKKAVLDEQNKSTDFKESIKNTEQKLRKRDQEIDSLTFRNEQLTKRISFLQQELQANNAHGKKNKNKAVENTGHFDISIVDEELHKKILENAELVSLLADKDMEIHSTQEQIRWLEQSLDTLKKELFTSEEKCQTLVKEYELEKQKIPTIQDHTSTEHVSSNVEQGQGDNLLTFWQQEAKRWRDECELLHLQPSENSKLSKYYTSQISDLIDSKQMAQSESLSLESENIALAARLEQIILEKNHLEKSILSNADELNTTSNNYKSQLDAMTEHLAAQNETIARQCDEILYLKHQMTLKK